VGTTVVILLFALGAALTRSMLVQTGFVSASCGRCGFPLERRNLGDPVCRCH
jgi:hypothetical protein